jgi:hypothetical protein
MPLSHAAKNLGIPQVRHLSSTVTKEGISTPGSKLLQKLDFIVLNKETWDEANKDEGLNSIGGVYNDALEQLKNKPNLSRDEVKKYANVKLIALAVIDSESLMTHTAKHGPQEASSIVRFLGIDPKHLRGPVCAQGETLTTEQICALHLNSTSSEIRQSTDPDLAGSARRLIVPAQLNPDNVYLKYVTSKFLEELDTGLAKLPKADGITIYRGLQFGTKAEEKAYIEKFKPGEIVTLVEQQMCSAKSPYPGGVIMIINTLEKDSRAVYTGDVNYNKHDQEVVLRRDTMVEVVCSTVLKAGSEGYNKLVRNTLSNESSGRLISGEDVNVIVVNELPQKK